MKYDTQWYIKAAGYPVQNILTTHENSLYGFKQINLLFRNNVRAFTEHWGKQNFCFDGSDTRWKCWVRNPNGVIMVAGAGRCGSFYELCEGIDWDRYRSPRFHKATHILWKEILGWDKS